MFFTLNKITVSLASELEQMADNIFKELFFKNFWWLLAVLAVVFLFIIINICTNGKINDNQLKDINKRIDKIEYDLKRREPIKKETELEQQIEELKNIINKL